MRLVPPKETAGHLRMSCSALDKMVVRGEFVQPYRITPGLLRFDLDKVDASLASQRKAPSERQTPCA